MPKKRASGPLTGEQLGSIAEKSLANVVDLIIDARDLYERGSLPRAFALVILAGEEFGKCQLAVGAIGLVNPDIDYWKNFWQSFYSHDEKLIRAAHIARLFLDEVLIEQFVTVLTSALREKRREAGLYVDMNLGEVVSPDEEIGDVEVLAALETFEQVIHGYSNIFDDRSLKDEFVTNTINAQKMRIAIDSGDIEEFKRVWLETKGREPTPTELELFVARWTNEDGGR